MPKVPLPHEEQDAPQETSVVQNTPFDKPEEKKSPMHDALVAAIGAGAITAVVTTGVIFVAAGALNLVTWALGGIAGILATLAPWVAVLLGVCAFSAYSK